MKRVAVNALPKVVDFMTTEVLFSESKSTIGLRVNPIVGDGDIKELRLVIAVVYHYQCCK